MLNNDDDNDKMSKSCIELLKWSCNIWILIKSQRSVIKRRITEVTSKNKYRKIIFCTFNFFENYFCVWTYVWDFHINQNLHNLCVKKFLICDSKLS